MRFNANLSADERERIEAPAVSLATRIGRYMGARKREWRSRERRSFPHFYPGMTTADYVRLYYRDNNLDRAMRGENVHGYPDSFITPIERPAPVNAPEGSDA